MPTESKLGRWWEEREPPKGLAPNGRYTESHMVRVDGGRLQYVAGGGVGVAVWEAAGRVVRILPRFVRRATQVERRKGLWVE